MTSGYYRFPTIHADTVVFVCEDDLWTVPVSGGIARRLTSNLGPVSHPFLSPDGTQLAFTGSEEGQDDIYVMPALGGPARRLTYMGGSRCQTAGWTQDGRVLFANNAGQPFRDLSHMWAVDLDGGPPEHLNFGPVTATAFGPDAGIVIGRNTGDPARWKRYRGGTTGQIWIDPKGIGEFQPLLKLDGNMASPMWIRDRIYFLSDHEGIGNLYSCLPSGDDLLRHSDYNDFYARNATSDGNRIVYHAGADLYVFDPSSKEISPISVELYSPQTQRNRKFIYTERYLESWKLHPQGNAIAMTARGKLFSFYNWEGAVMPHGEQDGVRYRLPQWLNGGKRLLAVTDKNSEEQFVIFQVDQSKPPEFLPEMNLGRPVSISVNPKKEQVVFSNHRFELWFLDLEENELHQIDRGTTRGPRGFAWSPDGEWLAYSIPLSHHVTMLKLWEVKNKVSYPLTRPVLHDVAPAFDPDGKYLYFLSYRHFDPVYDNLQFDLNFPGGVKPYLITLQKDLSSPFVPQPIMEEEDEKDKGENDDQESDMPEDNTGEIGQKESPETETDEAQEQEETAEKEKKIIIDLSGIEKRVIAFPVRDGLYGRIMGIAGSKVIYSHYPIEGTLGDQPFSSEPDARGTILIYDFEKQKEDTLIHKVTAFDLSQDAKTLLYLSKNRLRVLPAGTKPDRNAKDKPGRESGWLNLGRAKVSIVPGAEWKQMFREAWRLQRDHFWTPNMSQVDWIAVHDRYLSLVDRISSRSEFSDLMWEMQGELGTSHAYEFGGDYPYSPVYRLGFLGAEYEFDNVSNGWKITHIVQGDSWDENSDSPLNSPGVNVELGDIILAINGIRLSKTYSPNKALVNLANNEVTLTIKGLKDIEETNDALNNERTVTVKTLGNEMPARYREWVEANRRNVHEATDERVGYVHIPSMMAPGYAEFHRGYLAEVDREGLIIDVRYNSGGHVSALILEKLARKRLGYDTSRWATIPEPYPPESVMGPMVALTNEYAGSDGDIFSHAFKMMGLGPLIGKRTWGGVIGISPKQLLVDRTITTQPEYSFWFQDVGWGVENYGTDPDIEVDNLPQDYTRGIDAQLVRAIEEINNMLKKNPPQIPDFKERPNRSLPKLPER
ncbi:MAG: PDZ domain-containing protein [Anaerolineaceae bacterium]|nr:PDZ domain-containing protein [Anaerolineaceae bacterium]